MNQVREKEQELEGIVKGLEGLAVLLIGERASCYKAISNYAVRNGWNLMNGGVWNGQKKTFIIGKLGMSEIENLWNTRKEEVVWVLDAAAYRDVKAHPVIINWIKLHMWDEGSVARAAVI